MENDLTGGPRMFNTLHGDRLNGATQHLSASDSQLTTLMNKHGARKFWAAVKAQGLEPEDMDKAAAKDEVSVHPKVPLGSQANIKAHRVKMWEDLRQSRLRDVAMLLEDDHFGDDEVRRYWKCESGVNPISAKDLPPVDQLKGMDQFGAMMEKMNAGIKEEQRRKANRLGLDFLTEKKKREEADAKVAAFEKRAAEFKKQQEAERKERAAASQKKAEKRKQDSERAAKARAEWEDETEAALWDRFQGARGRRNHRYSPEGLAAKLEANMQKRINAFLQAREIEEQMLEDIENRRIATEERLEARNKEVQARLDQQIADRQAAFQHKQVVIHAKTTEWVENKLREHGEFERKVENSRQQYKDNLKEKSKSTGDIRKKMTDKVNQNKARLKGQNDQDNQDLMDRHAAADRRREELNAMKFKNENDIYTFREIKHESYGELTSRRNEEIRKRTDAQHQACIIDLAERHHKGHAQYYAKRNLHKCRQDTNKESLSLMDRAAEGFLKIQSEPDEGKVIAHMNAMGFDMPKLPEKDDEDGGGDEEKRAF